MFYNISVNLKCGGHIAIHCEHFHLSESFLNFTIDNYIVCTIYVPDIANMYSFEYRLVNGVIVKDEDLLLSDDNIIKVI